MSSAAVKGAYLSMRHVGPGENLPRSMASRPMDAAMRQRLYGAQAGSTRGVVLKTIYLGDAIC
jgi:hypothetical protein